MLLSDLFGSETAEKVLLYMQNYGSGYPQGVATVFGIRITPVQRQLEKFEIGGILASRLIGRTRQYQWNPRYAFQTELRLLLKKALSSLPEDYQKKYFRERSRPRRKGKPLP